jgi:hypothetical protein
VSNTHRYAGIEYALLLLTHCAIYGIHTFKFVYKYFIWNAAYLLFFSKLSLKMGLAAYSPERPMIWKIRYIVVSTKKIMSKEYQLYKCYDSVTILAIQSSYLSINILFARQLNYVWTIFSDSVIMNHIFTHYLSLRYYLCCIFGITM